jgi:hypothetical protein
MMNEETWKPYLAHAWDPLRYVPSQLSICLLFAWRSVPEERNATAIEKGEIFSSRRVINVQLLAGSWQADQNKSSSVTELF